MSENPRRTGADYAQAWTKLLPTGPAWPRDPESVLMRFLDGQAQIWADRVDARAHDFLDIEALPDTTTEMLDDWERVAGLPEDCFTEVVQSVTQRRYLLLKKLTSEGGQSRAFFLQLANELGFPSATITEWSPFVGGISRGGDARWHVGSQAWRFFWTMYVGPAPVTWFRGGTGHGGLDPHARFGRAAVLECLVRKWKPAHTEVAFKYSRAA